MSKGEINQLGGDTHHTLTILLSSPSLSAFFASAHLYIPSGDDEVKIRSRNKIK